MGATAASLSLMIQRKATLHLIDLSTSRQWVVDTLSGSNFR